MGQRGLSFVAMGDQVEVHRDARAQPVQTTEQALRVVRVVRRGAVAGLEQRARQVQLRAVHREQPMPLPARPHAGLAGAPEQLGVQRAEQVLVHLGAGGAHRRGRHRGGLRQRHALATALVPQLGQGRAVPLPVLRQHQAEHEQHHEQRVQRTPAPLPVPVEVASHRHHRVDQRPPPFGQGVRRPPRRRRARRAPAPFDQDRPEVLVQRLHEHAFRRARRPLARGLAQVPPVRRTVAGAVEPGRVDEGLHQHRAVAVARLPVVRQPARRQRQGLGRQVGDAHPRQDQEAGVADHPVQALAPGRLVPADEVVAARQQPGRVGEQQAAQPAGAAIDDGVTQMRTDRAAVAQVMVPVDQFVPSRDLVRLRHHAQLQGLQPLHGAADLGARLGAGGPCRRLLRPAPLRLVLVRQDENAEFLQLFEQASGAVDAVAAARGMQLQVLAHGVREFVAAQPRKAPRRALHVGDLAARQAPPEEGGRLQFADGFVHRLLRETVRPAYGPTREGVRQAPRRLPEKEGNQPCRINGL